MDSTPREPEYFEGPPIKVFPEFMPRGSHKETLRKTIGFLISGVGAGLLFAGVFILKGIIGMSPLVFWGGLTVIALGFLLCAAGAALFFGSRRHFKEAFRHDPRDDDHWAGWPWLG